MSLSFILEMQEKEVSTRSGGVTHVLLGGDAGKAGATKTLAELVAGGVFVRKVTSE